MVCYIQFLALKSPINNTIKKYIIFNEIARSFRTSFSQNTSLVTASLIWLLLISNFLKYPLLESVKTHSPIFGRSNFWKVSNSINLETYENVLTWFLVEKLGFFYPFRTSVSFTWKLAKRFHFKSSEWRLYD